MSMGSGGGTQTTTSQAEPWKASQPYLTDAMRRAQGLVGRDASGMPSTVAPFDPATQTGLGMLENQAMQPDPLAASAQGAVGDVLNGQIGDPSARGIFQAVAGGAGINPYTNQITAAGATPTTAGTGILNQFAQGGANPYLDRAFDQGAAKVTDAMKSAFFGQGSGSGYQQKIAQEGLNDLATNIYGGAYESDANRRLQAAGLLPQIEQADRAARLGSLGTAAGLDQQDWATRLSAGGYLDDASRADAQMRVGATGLLPGIRDYANSGARDLLTVGAQRENLQNELLADQMMRYQQPWSDLTNYSGIISGFGGLGGTQTSTAPKQRSNPLMGGLSGASGMAGLAGILGLSNPLTAGAMGLGGLLGAFG